MKVKRLIVKVYYPQKEFTTPLKSEKANIAWSRRHSVVFLRELSITKM